MKAEKRCPIPKTHTRLRQVHTHWHEAAEAYAMPDLFVPRLNSLVQAARNTTWVLQSEMSHDDGFAPWYESWQGRMRADERMRWLVNARNRIEKQGDLEIHSVAKVRVLAGAWAGPEREFAVPPQIGPVEIAMASELEDLPPEVKESGLLEVERRWIVPDRPDFEVLDLIAYCYGMLAQLLIDAHARRGVDMRTFGVEDHECRDRRFQHPTGRLDCMLIGREQRTARWHLGQEALIELEARKFAPTDERLDFARSHYEDMGDWPKTTPAAPLVERAAIWHEWGRRMLVRDGGHRTVASLFSGGGLTFVDMTPDDDQAKRAMMAHLAVEVDRLAADELIFTAEAWFALDVPPADPRFGVRARNRADREDVLITYALGRDGERLALSSRYEVENEVPVFDPEPVEMDFDFGTYFGPVIEAWESWPFRAVTASSGFE